MVPFGWEDCKLADEQAAEEENKRWRQKHPIEASYRDLLKSQRVERKKLRKQVREERRRIRKEN